MYHIAPAHLRDTIQREGLKPGWGGGQSTGNTPFSGTNAQLHGVYLSDYPGLIGLRDHSPFENLSGGPHDIWEVDTRGLPLHPDYPALAEHGAVAEPSGFWFDDDEAHEAMGGLDEHKYEQAMSNPHPYIQYTGTALHPGYIPPERIRLRQMEEFGPGKPMPKRTNVLDPVHDVLPPIVWDNPGQPRPHLKKQHRDWIMREVMSLASKFEPNPEQWLTMVLTGSLTTFQYSDTSDCDVSLFVDPFKLPDWDRGKLIGLMVSKMDGTRLPGTPFEMQCFVVAKDIHQADLYQPGLRSGYDIKAQTWIVPPDPTRTHDVQREQNQDYIYALESADKMERLLRYEPDKAIQFWHQIHKRRMRDQKAGKGDYSQANIVYKFLANRGLFPAISQASGEYIAKQLDCTIADLLRSPDGDTPRWTA